MISLRTSGSRRSRPAARFFVATFVLLALVAPVGAGPGQPTTNDGPTWATLSPPSSPPALEGAAAAYDDANRTVVVFGGELPDGSLSNETWIWDGTTWSHADQGFGTVPPARYGASMAYDSRLDQLILFGGQGRGHTLLDDTWLWNGISWIQVNSPNTPGARTDAALAPDPNGNLVLFGGYGVSNASLEQTTPSGASPGSSSSTSSTSSIPTTSGTGTTGTGGSGAPGGASPSSSTTTTVPSTGSTTTTVPSTSTSVPSTGSTTTTVPSTGSTTTTVPSTSTSVPSTGSTTTTIPTSGGGGSGTQAGAKRPRVLDDTWLLESTSQGDDWVPATTPVHPAPAEGAGASETSTGTVLFGGSSSPPSDARRGLSDKTWTWNGQTWSLVRTSVHPPARTSAVEATDPAIGGVVAFGGLGASGPLGGAWTFEQGQWQRLSTSSPPAARFGAIGVYDSESRQILVFGGIGPAGHRLGSTVVLAAHAPVSAPSSPSTTISTSKIPTTTTTTTEGSPSTTRAGSTTTSAAPTPTSSTTAAATSGKATALPAKPTRIHPGDVLILQGGGFAAGARVVVTFEPTRRVVAITRADGAGRFRVEVTIPDGATVGAHDFLATGTGPRGPVNLVTPVRVAAYTRPAPTSPTTEAALVALALAVPALTLLGLRILGRSGHRAS